ILVNNQSQGMQGVFYISPNGTLEKVNIDDFNKLLGAINDINQIESKKIHLSTQQVNDLITLNGGHSPKQHLIKQQVSDAIHIAKEFFYELIFFSGTLQTITGNIEERKVVLTNSDTYLDLIQETSFSEEISNEKNQNLQESEM